MSRLQPQAPRTVFSPQGTLARTPALLVVFAFSLWTACAASASQVTLDVALDTPVLLAGESRTAYLRVALKGFERDTASATPVNLAVVLDRSGSMQGQKLQEAKEAAVMAIQRLGPNDIVSVVTYDSTVHVLVPATKVTDRERLCADIRRLEAGSNTALFAGVAKGAGEARKFLANDRVNRVILLSDGLANVGPSSPGELADLGATLAREGIAVTTIGLGLDYGEELMNRLAEASDGNHFFAETAADLERVYRFELGEVLSVVAQNVDVQIELPHGVRPLRILGREATIDGQRVSGWLNQLYSRQTKYFIVQVEVPAGRAGDESAVAKVEVSYNNMVTHTRDRLTSRVAASFTASMAEVEAAQNGRVMSSVARQLGAEQNRHAMRLRDDGKVEEARAILLDNAEYLAKLAELYGNAWLERDSQRNLEDAQNLDPEQWQRQRKEMTKNQFEQLRALGYIE